MLSKASVLEQLRPGHELATDKELLLEQSRALQAAHESAAAAHLAAAAHRVGERALAVEVSEQEVAPAPKSPGLKVHHSQMEADRRTYEQSSLDFLAQQELHNAAALRRAGCEMRVLVRSLQEAEVALPAAPRGGSPAPKPRDASPRDTSPRPAKPPAGKAPPKAPKGKAPARK